LCDFQTSVSFCIHRYSFAIDAMMTTVEEVYLKNYIYREPINILEELNDQIHETLATVIPNMLRLARENLMKRARLFLQMNGGHFEHLL
jgi:hypothetical protein